MKRLIILTSLLALAWSRVSAGVVTLGTFAVNPQGTFLYESSNDSNVSALFINLMCPVNVTTNCVNAGPGTTLQIIGLGGLCFFANPCSETAGNLGGVFDSNNILLNSSTLDVGNVNRLTGSINSGAPNTLVNHNPFLNTFFGNVDTTIANDFFIPAQGGITVVVPAGAAYLVVGVLDSYFADNSDPLHTLSVQINQITQNVQPVPEAGTLGLLGLGIAGLIVLRFYRSS